MVRFRNFGLLTKTTVITLVILAGFFAIATYSSYRQHKALIIQEAVQKARIIAFEAIRGREYLSQQLKEGLEQPGDEDMFRFDAADGETHTFRLEFPAGPIPDTVLNLLDQDGRSVLRPWSHEYGTWVELDGFPAGTYYVRVRNRLAAGAYRLVHEVQ